tara:strand:+ start:3536 stop:4360 length:825 start_codon:yes stop_codon:yes gene_type:complete
MGNNILSQYADYKAYNNTCRSKSIITHNLDNDDVETLDRLNSDNFFISKKGSDKKLIDLHLSLIFNQILASWENPTPSIARAIIPGYTVHKGLVPRNLVYVGDIKKESLAGIRNFLIESGLKDVIESRYQCPAGVCNVRAYAFSHDPDNKNTHHNEKFDNHSVNKIGQHKDVLPPETLKIMVFKNRDGSKLDEASGGLQLLSDKSWITISGQSPCVIFNSCALEHRSQITKPGNIRDAIEITIIPFHNDSFPIVSAGGAAGCPLNPASGWDNLP